MGGYCGTLIGRTQQPGLRDFELLDTALTMSLSGTLVVGAGSNPVADILDKAGQVLKEDTEKIMRALKLILHAELQY